MYTRDSFKYLQMGMFLEELNEIIGKRKTPL